MSHAATPSAGSMQQAVAVNNSSSVQSTNANANAAAVASGSGTAGPSRDIPRDARIISLILASMGVTDAEPGVVAMLLEFAHRYTHDILSSALAYSEHAQRPRDTTVIAGSTVSLPTVELDDLRLAVSSKLEHSYSSPWPKEFLMPLAGQINRVPLPILPESYGIRLPPERERLTGVNWDYKPVLERRTFETTTEDGEQQQQQTGAKASTTTTSTLQEDIQKVLNGDDLTSTSAGVLSGMDLDLANNDLFGGVGEDDDDDEDEDDMEEVIDPALGRYAGAQQQQQRQRQTGMNEDDDEDDEGGGNQEQLEGGTNNAEVNDDDDEENQGEEEDEDDEDGGEEEEEEDDDDEENGEGEGNGREDEEEDDYET